MFASAERLLKVNSYLFVSLFQGELAWPGCTPALPGELEQCGFRFSFCLCLNCTSVNIYPFGCSKSSEVQF